MLEVRNIAFTYDRRPVLRDVSFVVSPGETVSIVGDNAVGKRFDSHIILLCVAMNPV